MTRRGSRVASWLLGFLVFSKGTMGLNCIFNGRYVATVADGIPVDTYGPEAARTVLAFFALWGLGQLLFALLGLPALVRFRAMVPLVFLVMLVEHLARKAILFFLPIAKTGSASGTWVNYVLLAVTIAGFALSVRAGETPPAE